jgi:hypothetical protein
MASTAKSTAMEFERRILQKLVLALSNASIGPLPTDEYLIERIRVRMKGLQYPSVDSKNNEISLAKFTSPVCFSAADEVQADYRTDTTFLSQIDIYIDELIQKQC